MAAGVVALLAGAGLWRLSSTPSPAPASEPPPAAHAEKAPEPPRYRVERAAGSAGTQVEVALVDAERDTLADFAARALVPLTPDEEALLREAHTDDLGELIARAEREYREAPREERDAKERRYLLAMNLAAKLATQEPDRPDAEARAVQARFLQALEAERPKWAGRSPEEQRRLQDEFKDDFFSKQGERR
ncbi:hypothetical protein P2318_30760 [Myxococcaceae bacterium GXIMD 01537]